MKNLNKQLICKECGYKSNQLHQHLKAIHNMTANEYREKYGENEIMQIGFKPYIRNVNEKSSQQVKGGHSCIKNKINLIHDIYTKNEVYEILLNDNYYLNYLGRGAWRTLINDNMKLYKSIYIYTDVLKTLFHKKRIPLNFRFDFIIKHKYDINKVTCKCGKGSFVGACKSCKLSFPSEQWFKINYPENYKEKYLEYHCKKSETWYSYSKVSQKLFWQIIYKLPELCRDKIYFGELQGEWKILLTAEERKVANQKMYFLDFLYENKNIEFDGYDPYFLIKKTDAYIANRDYFLNKRGYRILRINERDYYKNQDKEVDKCIQFLTNEN